MFTVLIDLRHPTAIERLSVKDGARHHHRLVQDLTKQVVSAELLQEDGSVVPARTSSIVSRASAQVLLVFGEVTRLLQPSSTGMQTMCEHV
jgi:hypothetical protein